MYTRQLASIKSIARGHGINILTVKMRVAAPNVEPIAAPIQRAEWNTIFCLQDGLTLYVAAMDEKSMPHTSRLQVNRASVAITKTKI